MYRKRAPILLGFFALLLVTGMGALAYDIAADQDDQDNEWTRQFGTPDNDFVGDVAVDESGNLYLVGWTDGALSGKAGLGNQDAYLRKYDGDGNELWTHQFGTQDYDRATGLALDNFGNPYVVGKVGGALPGQTHSGGQDAYLRKYDTDGTELWTRQFGTAHDDTATGVVADRAGNLYVIGRTLGVFADEPFFGGWDAYVRKYDSNGNELWTRQFGTADDDVAAGLTADGAGNTYIVGNTFGVLPGLVSSGERDAFIVGYDSAGNGLWTRQFGTRGWDDAKAVAVDGDGNLYMVGDTPGVFAGNSNLGRFDAYLRKYDRTGNELWTRQFGSQHFDFALDVVVAGTANVHVVGWTRGILPGQTHLGVFDAYLSTFDFEGIHLWSRQFGTQLDDSTSGLAVDGEGNLYVVGDTHGAFPGQVSLGLGDGFLSRMSSASAPAQAVDEIPTPTVMTAPDILWTRQFGTGTDDFAADIALDGEGNQYVAGNTFGVFPGENGSGGRDAYLLKHDVEGNQLWVRQFGSEINDDARDVEVDDAGNVYVLGSTSGSLPGWANLGMDDSYLRKYDADGNELWTRQFGTKNDDQARGLELDGAGNLYVVLQTRGEIANLTHVRELGEAATPKSVYLSKYDPNGNEPWVRQFPSIIVELAFGVTIDGAGNLYVVGDLQGMLPGQTMLGGRDAFLRSYDSDGNQLSALQFGSADMDRASGVGVDGSGNIFVAGSTQSAFPGLTSAGRRDAFLREYGNDGTELRTVQFGTKANDSATDVAVDPSRNVYLVGETGGAFPGQVHLGDGDAYVRKYFSDGDRVWTRQFGTQSSDKATSVGLDDSGNVYVVGTTSGALPGQAPAGGIDGFLVKLPATSSLAPTALPAPTPTPQTSSGGGCTAPAGKVDRLDAGWLLLGSVWPWLALAGWRKRQRGSD